MKNPQITIREKKLGLLIHDARMVERRSIKECADAIGVSVGILRSYEDGHRSPSLPELEALALFLKLPLSHFWGNELQSNALVENLDLKRILSLRQKMVGALLRQERMNINMSLKFLSQETGITQARLKAYEMGEYAVTVPELEMILGIMGSRIEKFFDQNGPIGQRLTDQNNIQKFLELPVELQNFFCQPINLPYLDLAIKLSGVPREKLRAMAEGLLAITS